MLVAAPLLFVLSQSAADPQSLWQDVTLYRDEWGTPHVYAEHPRALGFGFGYAQAEDHFEPMLLAYRLANGRLAEVMGESEADSDAFSLKMGHGRLARAAFPSLDPDTIALCEGFALGVNAWLLEHAADVPQWAEGIQPPDILALWHAYLMSFAPFDLPGVWTRRAAANTGNAWAVATARSEDGVPMLAINPHEYHDGPFRWYEAHLAMPGYDVAGATLFGLPILLVGHNAHLGWSLTPNGADFADMFLEQFGGAERNPKVLAGPTVDDEAAMILLYMSHAQPYYVRTEAGLEERMAPAYVGPRGPVFEAEDGQLYSWRIGGYDAFGGLLQLLRMGAATDLTAFQEALTMQQLPCFHVLYADADSNLFYLYNTMTGERPRHLVDEDSGGEDAEEAPAPELDWQSPLPAALAGLAWRNIVPVMQLPYVTNPPAGYLQACGNPPWTVTKDAPLDPEAWPRWLVMEQDGYRAKRARQLLQTGAVSRADMEAMLFDVVLPAAVDLAPALVATADAAPEWVEAAHPDLSTGIELLRDWNYIAGVDSEAMTFFHVWWAALAARMDPVSPSPAELYEALRRGSPDAAQLVLEASADAVRMLRNDFDTVRLPWGDVHRMARGIRDEPIFGAATGEPLFIASDQLFEDGRWYANYGYGFAMLVAFGETPEAKSIVPFGASENPTSAHFDDQMELLLARRLKPTHYVATDVWRHAQSALGSEITLAPPGTQGVVRFRCEAPARARLPAIKDAPGLLPPGQTPFTLYMKPEWDPAEVAVTLGFELTIGPDLCHPDNVSRLALFHFSESAGWQRVPQQKQDPVTNAILAESTQAGVYAVLGPLEALKVAPAPVVPGKRSALESAATDLPAPLTPSPVVTDPPDARLPEQDAAAGVTLSNITPAETAPRPSPRSN